MFNWLLSVVAAAEVSDTTGADQGTDAGHKKSSEPIAVSGILIVVWFIWE
jgi:hypothetical protein